MSFFATYFERNRVYFTAQIHNMEDISYETQDKIMFDLFYKKRIQDQVVCEMRSKL
jgi:hypothetical protein